MEGRNKKSRKKAKLKSYEYLISQASCGLHTSFVRANSLLEESPFLLPFLAFSPGAKSTFSPLTHSPSWPPPSPPPPLDSGGLLILELLLTSLIPCSGWQSPYMPSCKLKPGERLRGEAGPMCFSPKLVRGKHMLCSVLCKDGRWCLLGTGCRSSRLFCLCQFGLTVSRPAATAVKQAPQVRRDTKWVHEEDTFFFEDTFWNSALQAPDSCLGYKESCGTRFSMPHGRFPAEDCSW